MCFLNFSNEVDKMMSATSNYIIKRWWEVMRDTGFFKRVKLIYDSFYTADGKLLDLPVGQLSRREYSAEAIKFMRTLIEFLYNSDALCKYAKIYLRSPASTLNDAFKNYNYHHPEDGLNVKTAISNMDYNRRKLLEIFPEGMLEAVILDAPGTDYAPYWESLEQAMSRYNKVGLFDNLSVKLIKAISSDKPDIERIIAFRKMIAPYTKKNRKRIEKEINSSFRDVIGYLNYLSMKPDRTEEENRIHRAILNDVE